MDLEVLEKISQDLEVKLQLLDILDPNDPHFKEVLKQANDLGNKIRVGLDFKC